MIIPPTQEIPMTDRYARYRRLKFDRIRAGRRPSSFGRPVCALNKTDLVPGKGQFRSRFHHPLSYCFWTGGLETGCTRASNGRQEAETYGNQYNPSWCDATTMAPLPCCPEIAPDDTCDILDFHYRLNYPVTVSQAGIQAPIPVEVKLHFRLTRCPGLFALGNLLYTNTLLPGEKVKLFTSDRRTKFTFDTTSQVSYRNT